MKRVLQVLAFMAVLVVSMSPQLSAQAVYGSIVGTVTDSSGAAVPAAKVTITDLNRQVMDSATANESGNYLQRSLIVGRYRVRIEAPGFKAFQQEVNVSVDTELRIDAKLEVGAVSETIEVTAEAGLLKTERSDVANTYNERFISSIPTLTRRFLDLQLMTPGSYNNRGAFTVSAEIASGQFHPAQTVVNGQSNSGSGYMLDGTDNHDAILSMIVIQPTLDSITEAKVTTVSFDAEFGNAGAAVISAQTKSGTNTMHGGVFEYLRNNHQAARNPFSQARPIPGQGTRTLPVSQWNQFGGSLGGAIKKNKLFYFGDYQATRRNSGGSTLIRVPTQAERNGDLSGLNRNIFDPFSGATPATRTQFPGNVIPPSVLAARGVQAQNLLKLIPLPNVPGTVLDQPNWAGSGTLTDNQDQGNVRVDYFATDKLHIFGRYSVANIRLFSPGSFGLLAGGTGFDATGSATTAYAGNSSQNNHSLALGADYAASPTLFTDFRVGWLRWRVLNLPNGYGQTPAADAGIPGLNNDKTLTSGMPAMNINDYANGLFKLGYGLTVSNCNCPLDQDEKQIQFVNNWTKVSGNHTIKFGADIRRAYNLRVASDRHRAGELQFNGARTQGPTGGGSGLATFLLGDVSQLQRYVSASTNARETQNRWFFFAQDSWKLSRKLILNYGLRWEIYRPQRVNGPGNGGNLDLNTGEVQSYGVGSYGLDGNVQDRLSLFAPRVGLAYQVTSKTVIRAGYGRGFSMGAFGTVFGHNVTQNLPVLASQTLIGANNFNEAFTLAAGPGATPDPRTVLNGRPLGPNGLPILPNGQTMFVVKPQITLPAIDSWNLTVQRQLTGTSSLEMAYVGTIGTHVFAGGSDYDPNQPSINGFGFTTTNQRKPFFQKFGWSQNLRYFGSDATSRYHALQVKFEKRLSSGLNVMTHFTYSKNIDYTNVYYPRDANLARGISNNSRPKALVFTSNYDLPFGRGRKFMSNLSKPVDSVLGGWQVNGVMNWFSGIGFTPSYQNCNADQDVGVCRPDAIGDVLASNPSQFGWFNTSSTVLASNGATGGPWQRPQKGKLGTVGRNRLIGPAFQQIDLSLFKTFRLTERYRMQFRAESFNFANHTNLAAPNTCVDCPGVAGRIFNTYVTYVPRTVQFALRVEF